MTGRRGVIYFLVLILVFVTASVATASEGRSDRLERVVSKIAEEAALGAIDRDTAAIYTAKAVFDPASLPGRFAFDAAAPDLETGEHVSCATGILNRLVADASRLSPAAREQVRAIMRQGLGMPLERLNRTAAPEASTAGRTDFPDGLTLSKVYKTEHFAIRYGSKNFDFDNYATSVQELGEALENAWDLWVDGYGYAAPYKSDQYYLDVFVGDSAINAPEINGSGAAAYVTFYDAFDLSDSMNVMVISKDILVHEGYTQDVVGHEFYHMIQYGAAFANNCYNYMFNEGSAVSAWAVEAAAVWSEEYILPDDNYWQYFVNSAQGYPERSIMAFDFSIALHYGRALFFLYLDENYGGPDALYEVWNECYNDILASTDAYLKTQSSDLATMFPKYALANRVRDYKDASVMDAARRHLRVTKYPAEIETTDELEDDVPENFAANNIRLVPQNGGTLTIKFSGEETHGSYAVNWALVYATETDKVLSEPKIGLVTGGDAADVTDTLTIEDFGDGIDAVELVVVPMTNRRPSSLSFYEHDYSLKIYEGDAPADDDDDDDVTDDDDDDVTDDDDDDASDDDAGDDDDDDASSDDDFGDFEPLGDDDDDDAVDDDDDDDSGSGCGA
ncbi:MAG: hypothetical protein H6685_06895 [Deltaproteobacteria bacterium]|nr:hypothetical protein [Deltaproteobacteria bacterium]